MRKPLPGIAFLIASFLLGSGAGADGLTDVLERGSLRIGVAEFAPWTFENRNGDLEGFEIDVARRIAQDMGVEPEFRVYVWEDIITGIERGEIDVIAAGMAITPSRALQVEFSFPYSESGTSIAINTRKIAAEVNTIDDLNVDGFVIAAVNATLAGDTAPLYFDAAEVELFAEPEQAETALLDGRAHAYLLSMPEAQSLVARFPDRVAAPLREPLTGSVAGFAVARGNQGLLNYLNAWIAAAKADNWLDSTYSYWFGGDAWLSGVDEED